MLSFFLKLRDFNDADYIFVELQSSGKFLGRCVLSQIQTLQPADEVIDHWYSLGPKPGTTQQQKTYSITGFLEIRLLYSKVPETKALFPV